MFIKNNLLPASLGIAMAVFSALTVAQSVRQEPIQPIAEPVISAPEKVELGKQLFFDPRLSMSGIISCNTCHNLSLGGTDNLATSIGHKWQAGPVNSPTVFNSHLSLAQFWDGRAADLQEQAAGPIKADVEMALPHTLAVGVIQSIPGYQQQFNAIYGDKDITIDTITDAIAEFEKTLATPNSRFDLWLKGDDLAINEQELRGYQLFKTHGCIGCHQGPALGGTSFHKMGLIHPYETTSPAQGRVAVTGDEADRFKFKVPTLRNVELTYPYFHDGQADTLEEAVRVMGKLQLNRDYSDRETADIVAFLKTLTGERPQIAMPLLPASTNETRRPTPFATPADIGH